MINILTNKHHGFLPPPTVNILYIFIHERVETIKSYD